MVLVLYFHVVEMRCHVIGYETLAIWLAFIQDSHELGIFFFLENDFAVFIYAEGKRHFAALSVATNTSEATIAGTSVDRRP